MQSEILSSGLLEFRREKKMPCQIVVLLAWREELDELPFVVDLREDFDLPVPIKKEASVHLRPRTSRLVITLRVGWSQTR